MSDGINHDEVRKYLKANPGKQFDLTEGIIMKYIAHLLNKNVKKIFPGEKHKLEREILSIEHEGKYYSIFLDILDLEGKNNRFMKKRVTNIHHIYDRSEKVRQAFAIIEESTYPVWNSLSFTSDEKYREDVISLAPSYDKKTYSFELRTIGKLFMVKTTLFTQISEYQNKLTTEKDEAAKEKLMQARNDLIVEYNKITNDDIAEEKKKIDLLFKSISKCNKRLIINISEKSQLSDEQVFKRIYDGVTAPVFTDPEENTEIVKVK